jgi:hypothetical protein
MGKRLSFLSMIAFVAVAGCGGRDVAPSVSGATAPQLRAGGTKHVYLASGGQGSGTWSWHGTSGEKCNGTLKYSVNVDLYVEADGKVETSTGGVTAAGDVKPYCGAGGIRTESFAYKVKGGKVSGNEVSVELTIGSGFCTPGTAKGTATLSGSVAEADLHMGAITETCASGEEKMNAGAATIRRIKGQLIGQ